MDPLLEVSVVMPCLNEAETLQQCIAAAFRGLTDAAVAGEVIVADNGSTDGSQDIALQSGARVINVRQRGYGAALRGGIEAARGRYIIMGDADLSYDFGSIPLFLQELRAGNDLVMGNRFRGGIAPGAMPWLHKYLGNPVLSALGRRFFRNKIGDFHCGMRGFSKAAFTRMSLVTSGMEFASEMVVKASLSGMRISEVPAVLRKDGRSRPPHLRTWRDGWRHLRFLLLFSPRWLFLIPGIVLMGLGIVLSAILIPGPVQIGGISLDIHALLVSGCMCLVGFQLFLFAVMAKTFVVKEGLHPPSQRLNRLYTRITLESGLIAGSAVALGGIALLIAAVFVWGNANFSQLDPRVTMRLVIPAVIMTVLGVEMVFGSFMLSVLSIEESPREEHIDITESESLPMRTPAGVA